MPIYQAPKINQINSEGNFKDISSEMKRDTRQIKFKGDSIDNTVTDMDVHARIKSNIGKKGLKIERKFTEAGKSPYADIKFAKRTSKIVNPDGTVVFELKDVEVPESWSQVATDILSQKYLRKRGVPQYDDKGNQLRDRNGEPILGSETSAKQAMHRLAGTWRHWGEEYGYFDSKEDAQAFEDEVKFMLMNQMAVPNSPQWFNTGLNWAYGIKGEAQGHYYVDPDTGKLTKSEDAYTRPQPHACFIQAVGDDLVNEGGIFDLVTKEARLFKFGSGTGTNFSKIRGKGEPLSGGGVSSGLMSFLKVLDTGAGAIQSGGTTRRAAKMVILNADHPEIETFIDWKVREEEKVADLVAGSHLNHKYLTQIMKLAESGGLDPEQNVALKQKIAEAKEHFVPLNYVKRVLMLVENGVTSEQFDFETFDTDFRSDAYLTVSGQNSNNSVRVTNEFIEAVDKDSDWDLVNRINGETQKTIKARDLWDQIAFAAWSSADPGMQYHTTINEWHTSPAEGEIHGSNPCSEYMFLDETACNLYQMNLIKFYDPESGEFNTEKFQHAVRICTIILEISVLMSQLPSKTMALGTFDYRTLGLGYANLGTLLMQMGLPYDSEAGFAVTGAVTAIMGGEAYATSAELAGVLGTFPKYDINSDSMLRVIRNHRRAAYSADDSDYEGLTVTPMKLRADLVEQESLVSAARESWDYALKLGEEYGYRNAQVTCLAPTGTSGLVMDCDTTGIEPDFALVKFKKLVGGGYFKIVNQSLVPALQKLGYPEKQIEAIVDYAVGKKTLTGAPHINTESLTAKGFGPEQITAIEAVLPTVFELKYAFNQWTLGADFLTDKLGITETEFSQPEFDLLAKLGFNADQIEEAGEYICGTMTVEGAPFLKHEHYDVFDCANKCGTKGTRYIHYKGHIKQMAAAQPFISGAISKTINMPEDASIEEVKNAYYESWQLMIKATALYRDGSKLSQPLNTGGDADSVYAKLFDFSEVEPQADADVTPERVQQIVYRESTKPYRREMPDERKSITHKFSVAGHEGFITVGLFEDGTPGELFITMSKEGSTLSGIINALAVSTSMNLQYGVPIETIVKKFAHVRFEPSGMTDNREIPVAKSIIDYIGRWLSVKFLSKERAKQYHNEDLVERSYSDGGSNERLNLISFVSNENSDPAVDESVSSQVDSQVYSHINTDEQSDSVVMYSAEEVAQEHKSMQPATTAQTSSESSVIEFSKAQQQMAMAQNNSGAPMCSNCGSVTVQNGACYKCPDCGTTTGCS